MAECDANYLRLMKLFPALRERDVSAFAVVAGPAATPVRIEVLERARYTTLLRLVQVPDVSWDRRLDLTVRLYHDARSAEVVEYQGKRHFRASYEYPNAQMRQPDEKAQLNRFLGEYLAHCLEHGVATSAPVLADG